MDKKDLDKFAGSLDSSLHNPLYIIDGEIMTEKWRQSDISVSDIKSVEILKDEAAIRLYGEKARNGVVFITTRHGKLPRGAEPPVPAVPLIAAIASEPPVPAVPVVAPVAPAQPVSGTPAVVPIAPVPTVTPVPLSPVVVTTDDSVKLTSSEMVIHQDSSLVNIQFSGSGTAVSRITDGRTGVIKITGSVKRIVPSTGIGEFKGLVILDGNEVAGTDLKKLDPATIKNMNIYKGEEAIKEYGEKGRRGVIVINSKK
jgi:TonB-dependent SusC/RagA subfamily outer membrane receptor